MPLAYRWPHWQNWDGPIIANNNLKADGARALLNGGHADAISFGRAIIANPDLPARIEQGLPLARPDFAHIYTGENVGYTDHPKAE
jgi:N-ethylmaleimide reductase